jgi:PTH1 family peptidyl-tRNA hydrolase
VLVVVGLGNPGASYARNRHNIGFRVAAAYREAAGLERFARAGEAEVSRGRRFGRPLLIGRPLGYMNRSGDAVAELTRRERVGIDELLVAVDDIYLPLGRLRLRREGGDGGHNGLKSIIETLGTTGFARLRFGVGSVPPGADMKDWVLEDFGAAEEEAVASAVERAVAVIDVVLREGLAAAMNRFNAVGGDAPEDSPRSASEAPPGRRPERSL